MIIGTTKTPSYNNVILHIVEENDCQALAENGYTLPCCEMLISSELRADIEAFFQARQELPCLSSLTKLHLNHQSILNELKSERLQAKVASVRELWELASFDWSKTLYFLLLRYFGFGINNEVMEALARSLDLRLLLKHNALEQEALLIGQAGLLEQIEDEAYRQRLKELYDYLSYKYTLQALPRSMAFKRLRTRPKNFPIARLRQFLELLRRLHLGADAFEACQTKKELLNLLRYGKACPTKAECRLVKSPLSLQAGEQLIINVVLPYMAFSSEELQRPNKLDPYALWSALKPEDNRITRLFCTYGLPNASAGDSQALLHLHKAYCLKKKCFFCPYGRILLSQKA